LEPLFHGIGGLEPRIWGKCGPKRGHFGTPKRGQNRSQGVSYDIPRSQGVHGKRFG
jgi:hypothetical protein